MPRQAVRRLLVLARLGHIHLCISSLEAFDQSRHHSDDNLQGGIPSRPACQWASIRCPPARYTWSIRLFQGPSFCSVLAPKHSDSRNRQSSQSQEAVVQIKMLQSRERGYSPSSGRNRIQWPYGREPRLLSPSNLAFGAPPGVLVLSVTQDLPILPDDLHRLAVATGAWKLDGGNGTMALPEKRSLALRRRRLTSRGQVPCV